MENFLKILHDDFYIGNWRKLAPVKTTMTFTPIKTPYGHVLTLCSAIMLEWHHSALRLHICIVAHCNALVCVSVHLSSLFISVHCFAVRCERKLFNAPQRSI